jgi:hypothetical protein
MNANGCDVGGETTEMIREVYAPVNRSDWTAVFRVKYSRRPRSSLQVRKGRGSSAWHSRLADQNAEQFVEVRFGGLDEYTLASADGDRPVSA